MRKPKAKRPPGSPAEFRTLIRHTENKTCGVPDRAERALERLKLEMAVAIDKNFWGSDRGPIDRPKTDPGAGGFNGSFRY